MAKNTSVNADSTATAPVVNPLEVIKRLCVSMMYAAKNLISLTPKGDPTIKGSMEKFTTLLTGILRAERRGCKWGKCAEAITVLEENLGQDFDVLVKYVLKTKGVNFDSIGDAARNVTARRTAVLECPEAKGYTLPGEFGTYAHRTAHSLAEDIGNPLKMLEILNGSR